MSVVAVYNMKGGVGKTTTAVNLAYLAASGGSRTLVWDLDPQAASSFALRVRPHVQGFGKGRLDDGEALAANIKETDYQNLDLLPADFAYRKFDRLLDHAGKPERVVTALLDTLRRHYDVVFLDCPAGFSLLTQGLFAAADAVLVPTIPTVLSLRMVARLIKWADRSGSRSELAAFFSMVDGHKTLHRRACRLSAEHPEVFLSGQIPYASVVEQMTVRRMPLPAFAPRDAATIAFAGIWSEIQQRLQRREQKGQENQAAPRDRWQRRFEIIESLIVQLESADRQDSGASPPLGLDDGVTVATTASPETIARTSATERAAGPTNRDVNFVHRFDTDRRDLERCGYVLELREGPGSLIVAVTGSDGAHERGDPLRRVEAQIDGWWATQILSGQMSPLEALERRIGARVPWLIETVRAAAEEQGLRRIGSCVADPHHARESSPGLDLD